MHHVTLIYLRTWILANDYWYVVWCGSQSLKTWRKVSKPSMTLCHFEHEVMPKPNQVATSNSTFLCGPCRASPNPASTPAVRSFPAIAYWLIHTVRACLLRKPCMHQATNATNGKVYSRISLVQVVKTEPFPFFWKKKVKTEPGNWSAFCFRHAEFKQLLETFGWQGQVTELRLALANQRTRK